MEVTGSVKCIVMFKGDLLSITNKQNNNNKKKTVMLMFGKTKTVRCGIEKEFQVSFIQELFTPFLALTNFIEEQKQHYLHEAVFK